MQTIRLTAAATLAVAVAGLVSTASADILITEFMPNPSGTDTEREWLELYNAGADPVDISNYKIGTSETPGDNEDMNQFPAGSVMAPGEVIIVATLGLGFQDWTGITPDFEATDSDPSIADLLAYPFWSGNSSSFLTMANSTDQLLLLDGNDTIVDYIDYGSADSLLAVPGTNQSWERIPANVDTDTAAEWVLRLDGEATPGLVTIPEPTGAALLGLGSLAMLRRRRA